LIGPNLTDLCPGEYCVVVTDLVSGCIDSVCIDINPTQINNTIVNESICSGDSIFLAGAYQNVSGTYYDTLALSGGCISVIQTNLTVNAPLVISTTVVDPSCDPNANCNIVRMVEWNDANCLAYSHSSDYSEFTPIINNADCSNITASNLDRNSGGHSCNTGRSGGNGMGFCIGGLDSPNYVANDSKALRFSITTGASDNGKITSLNFYELSTSPIYQNGISGSLTNDYPTKYGVRVLKDGVEIFNQSNYNTSQHWSLESIDFASNSDFAYSGSVVFDFELFAYSPVGNGYSRNIWDLDEIYVEGCCTYSVGALCDGSINTTVTGGTGSYNYSWTDLSNGSGNLTGPNISGLCKGDYQLTVTDADGCSQTTLVNLADPACTATPRFANFNETKTSVMSDMVVYPNPSLGMVNIRFESSSNIQAEISLMDLTGRLVFNNKIDLVEGHNHASYNFEHLPKGVYILKSAWGNDFKTFRVVIQ
ncbi:MAG: T9SS type A sorting domain-containing protein, partial [Bacteroidia bacterium]|nr:T9SS type A sorting domain-containing protein [Bacteroidia bacterium]